MTALSKNKKESSKNGKNLEVTPIQSVVLLCWSAKSNGLFQRFISKHDKMRRSTI